ncbi:substrate-binding periplasmic protein [Inhella gelatinilytica]|uniref:Transporter substrate-binding domain-containing protein n=1 Tax=Inhella gelatinilytica TaxID=2795030 RepID=A0A931IRT1_9BURK|nr:transporter substrate-binding domain-containing protein [Inhella gelatinilytica]MBH9551497.1 transporter substrate-binding domain-containing protein [Inhella gelatinilytica]
MRSWVLAFIVAAPGFAPPVAGATLTVKAGVVEGLPGYELKDGELRIEEEFKRKLFDCVAKTLDARFVWQALPTRRLIQMVVERQLDVAFPMGFSEERAARMLQSQPLWDNPDLWLSLRPINPADKSLRVAARLGSPQEAEQTAAGYARVVGANTYEELGKTLRLNLVDAVVVPRSIYEELKPVWPEGVSPTLGKTRSTGFYLSPQDPKGLATPLNRAIEHCRANPK